MVPEVASGFFSSAEQLQPLLDTPSAYRDSKQPVEGIVVRIDDDVASSVTPAGGGGSSAAPAVVNTPSSAKQEAQPASAAKGHLLRRGKFVRADFVRGIEDAGHWSKGALVKNVVLRQ